MPTRTRSRLISGCQILMVMLSLALAVFSASAAQLNLASVPLYAGGNVPPIVMIDLSKDQALYQKAYNDYSDMNGDGKIDTTYDDSIDYAGYFDSFKCYTYSTAQHAFLPASIIQATPRNHYCPASSAWSGNFLNWSSMTRMDAVRKILYGGYRSTDTSTNTILERAFLPMDAHSWAKYYNGADLPKLTPYTYGTGQQIEQTAPTFTSTSSVSLTSGTTSVIISTSNQFEVGDQMKLVPTSAPANSMTGWVTAVSNGSSGSKPSTITVNIDSRSVNGTNKSYSSWTVSNLSRVGLTLCNTTPNDSGAANRYSQSNNASPEIRAAKGNYALWGASERWQCNWASEHSATQGANLSNGNLPALSGLNASAENPPQATRGIGTGEATGQYYARVQVCVSGMIGNDNCHAYNSAQKPIGLLHTYSGISGSMLFGLMTGTYDRNISGGVLRRNPQDFNSEINSTDGTFNTSVKGIVWNINHLRIYGYSYKDGTYFDPTDSSKSDNCNFQQTGITLSGGQNALGQPAQQGNCSTWGNPMAEVYMESLRFLAGANADSMFSATPATRDQALGLTTEAWKDPLTAANYCTPLNTLVFNASVSSYDGDQLSGFSSLGTTTTAASWTDKVGTGEQVDGKSWFAGSNGTATDNLCSAKVIGKLSQALGLCPESPSQQGTFNIAGAAYYAHTNRIRPPTNVVSIAAPSNDTTSLKVTSYGVQLATNTPRITVNVGGKNVTLMPAYSLGSGATSSTGQIVDFKVISQDSTSGKFYVNWEDSIAGGDYDQDVWGILSYTVSGNTISVSTQVITASSVNPQGFGYVISGTNADGPHFHSGAYGYVYDDPTPVPITPTGLAYINTKGGCKGCLPTNVQTTASYTATGTSAAQFLDPLLYAAKWGAFKDSKDKNGNMSGTPDVVTEWDNYDTNGNPGADGIPDNYFYVTNPANLQNALNNAFLNILQTSSAASVATNSSSLNTGSVVYQAQFNGANWSGQLLALSVDANGIINTTTPRWDARAQLAAQSTTPSNRNILTFDATATARGGIPFRWPATGVVGLPSAYQTTLNQTDSKGSLRLDWLRGDHSNEGSALRARPLTSSTNWALGDIVNSSPQYVGPPNAGYPDADYAAFVSTNKGRSPMLYVGANDGMLHAIRADTGAESFAYIPSPFFSSTASGIAATLPALANRGYTHKYYVDGTPVTGDAKVNGNWATLLVGSLGAGGAGIFALDVTKPDSITEASANQTVLWEFTNQVDADLGYTFGQPSIVKLANGANGRWAAIFGNGYNSTAVNANADGTAYLYIVFLDRQPGSQSWVAGTDYLKIPTGTGSKTNPNGLSQPTAADANQDGTTDYIYAGDLLGNLWKFDVTSTNPANWGVPGTQTGTQPRTPLFVARNSSNQVQPITSPVDITRNPYGGYLILFGTGRYLDTSDPGDLTVQSFYGIWDRNLSTLTTVPRSALVQQSILQQVTSNGYLYRMVSQNAVAYGNASPQQGWYMDLVYPANSPQGERVAYGPSVRGDRIIFTTLIPSAAQCENGGTSWLMEVQALTGGHLANISPFDVNGDHSFTPADFLPDPKTQIAVPVGGRGSTVGITPAPTVTKCGPGKECKISSGSSANIETIAESAANPSGRLAWREILH